MASKLNWQTIAFCSRCQFQFLPTSFLYTIIPLSSFSWSSLWISFIGILLLTNAYPYCWLFSDFWFISLFGRKYSRIMAIFLYKFSVFMVLCIYHWELLLHFFVCCCCCCCRMTHRIIRHVRNWVLYQQRTMMANR